MAHGDNAKNNGHCGREYQSGRGPRLLFFGKWGKHYTHRLERREKKMIEKDSLIEWTTV